MLSTTTAILFEFSCAVYPRFKSLDVSCIKQKNRNEYGFFVLLVRDGGTAQSVRRFIAAFSLRLKAVILQTTACFPQKAFRFSGTPRKHPKKTMFFRGPRNELIKIYLFKFPKNDKKQREKKAADFALFKCGNKRARNRKK